MVTAREVVSGLMACHYGASVAVQFNNISQVSLWHLLQKPSLSFTKVHSCDPLTNDLSIFEVESHDVYDVTVRLDL